MEDDLCIVERNLTYLNQIKRDLEYNIQLHKSGSVISVMKEYKRSVLELDVANKEIILLESHKNQLKKDIDKKYEHYQKKLDEFEKIYVEESQEVVLPFKGKNG